MLVLKYGCDRWRARQHGLLDGFAKLPGSVSIQSRRGAVHAREMHLVRPLATLSKCARILSNHESELSSRRLLVAPLGVLARNVEARCG